ncbi:MAG TPA: LLM class flavin-dependent oxidoreductase, partial [Jatrophihabitans sp.]|nr:LLM class flavin-dependent oxidoreductase [Jatrophihabitans sp.]
MPNLALIFPPHPPEQFGEVVRAAEQAGVPELWIWEDCFREAGIAMAAAALAWTQRLRVGIGILPVPLRNPALTAMELATLARLFPGRLRPGIGHGVAGWMRQVGGGVESPLTLLGEHTAAIRALLHGETVSTAGRYVTLDAVALDYPPQQVPPLYVGGRGPRTLQLAGRLADGAIYDEPLAGMPAAAEALRAGWREAERPDEPEMVVWLDAPDDASAAAVAAEV